MAWWDHEELKSPENRSDRYIATFPEGYSKQRVFTAYNNYYGIDNLLARKHPDSDNKLKELQRIIGRKAYNTYMDDHMKHVDAASREIEKIKRGLGTIPLTGESDARNLPGVVIGKPNWQTNDIGEVKKYDKGKIRIELFPPEALFGISQVLTYGAEKYSARGWEKGMEWGRVFGALMRHLWAWWAGKGPTTQSFLFEEFDTDTKLSHLWHAGCCLVFLIAYEERKIGIDDRLTKNHHLGDLNGKKE